MDTAFYLNDLSSFRGTLYLAPFPCIGLEKRDTLSDRLWCAHVACHAHVLLMRGHAEKFLMTATPKEGPFPSICGK